MATKNNLLDILKGVGNTITSAVNKSNNQTQATQSASIGRSIDSQQDAWNKALADQPSTFKTWNPDVPDTSTQKSNPLLSFTDEWKQQQAEKKEEPKKKSWFASLIEDANKKSEENPWGYDATNNIIDTTPKAETPKEEPKKEPKAEERKPLEYSDAFLKQEEQKDAWSPNWTNDKLKSNFGEWGSNVLKGAGEGTIAALTGAERLLFEAGQKARTSQYEEDRDELQRQLDQALHAYEIDKEDGMPESDLQADLNIINSIQTRLDAYNKVIDEGVQEKATKATSELSNQLQEESTKYVDYAKEALGNTGLGNFVTDVAVNALQMAGDAAMNLVAPGTSLATMGLRTAGSAGQEAEAEGASLAQQLGYATVKGGIEMATEMMFDGLAGAYGKGTADDVVEELIRRMTTSGNETERTALRMLFSGLGEAAEEGVSGAADPLARTILEGIQSLPENYNKDLAVETLYSMLVGFAMGGGGGAVNIATGGNAQSNAELAETDAIQAQLEAEGVDTKDAQAIAPIVKKANSGEQLTRKEKNIILEILNREDVNAGTNEAVNAVEEVAPEVVNNLLPTEQVGNNPSKAAQLQTELDTANENQVSPTVTETAPQSAPTAQNPSKAAQLQTELDKAETNAPVETNVEAEQKAEQPGPDNTNKKAQLETELDKAETNKGSQNAIETQSEEGGTETPSEAEEKLNSNLEQNTEGEANTEAEAEENAESEQAVEERLEEIQQEIADLEQQVPSAERNQAILDLVEERSRLMNGETTQSQSGTNTENNSTESENQQTERTEPFIPTVNENAKTGQTKISKTSTNTLTNVANQYGIKQTPLTYLTESEHQSLTAGMSRANADMVGEMESLAAKETWTNEDVDTAVTIQSKLLFDSVKTGDTSAFDAWAKVVQAHGTKAAQALQAFGKWARTGSAAAADASTEIDANNNLTPEQKSDIKNNVYKFAEQFDSIAEDDVGSLIDLILEQNKYRNTGTFVDENYENILRKIKDYNWLKEYALRQMMAIPADFTETASLAQKTKTWQVNSQLTRLGTFFRNLGGNATFGVLDTFSQDALGYAIDYAVSKLTGRQEVGFDKGWLSRKARNAAVDAAYKSILEVAGDVDMGDSAGKYGTTSNRTNKMSSEKAFERFMSRWEQLLGYSLTTSDRFFRGQIEQSYAEGLKGVTPEEAAQLAEAMADYRLFQNNGLAAQFSKGAHNLLNLAGFGGEVKSLQGRVGGFGLGDLVNPYPGVPANLAVKLLEYSPANIVKGGIEIVKLLRDAKLGQAVTGQQMTAVMDIARGITGMGVVALFSALAKSGLFRNSDDEDDYDVSAQQAAQGLSGVQWNLDATLRALKGGKADWKDGDALMKISWLEPLNAFMSVASLISNENEDADLSTYAGDYMQGAVQAFLDLPVMGNIQNAVNTFKYSTGDTFFEKLGQGTASFLGSSASGMIPAPISQLARTTDEYYRDTSGKTKAEAAYNSLLNSIPGLRNNLPTKTDNFGNAKLNEPNQLLRALNSFVLPGTINTFMQSDVEEAVASVYEATGKTSVYPDRKGVKSLTQDGKTYDLTEDEQKKYHETAGKKSEQYISDFIDSKYYDDLTDEQRADIMSELNSAAKDYAKYEYLKGKGIKADDPSTRNQADMIALKTLSNKSNGSFSEKKDTDYATLDFIVKNIYPSLSKDEKDKLKSNGSYSRLDDMAECAKVGIDSKTFNQYLNQYRKIDKDGTKNSTAKAEAFSAYIDKQTGLSKKQKTALKNSFKYATTIVASTKSYDKWVNAGLSPDDAQGFSKKANADGKGTNPTNKEWFAAIEKYATSADMAEKLWQATGSATTKKKTYQQANPSTKFKGQAVTSSGSSSSSSSSPNNQNDLLAILSGTSKGTSSSSSSSKTKDQNELLNILAGKG